MHANWRPRRRFRTIGRTTMAADIRIAITRQPDPVAYTNLIDACDNTLIYATLDFHRFLAAAAGGEATYLLAWRGERLRGAAVYFTKEVDGGRCILNSLPWYGTHGGCLGLAEDDSIERMALAGALATALQSPSVIAGTIVLSAAETRCVSSYLTAFAYAPLIEPRIGQITQLPAAGPEEIDNALFATVRQKTRNLIRKSLRQGFEEQEDDSLDAWRFLHEVHAENMVAIGGKAKPWSHFAALRQHLPSATRRLSLARLDGEPVAAMLLLSYRSTVEYITPVIRAAYRDHQPLSFLIWRAMQWAVGAGYRRWNWGGTWASQHSLHHFKAGWGADDAPYQYLVYATHENREYLRTSMSEIAQRAPYYYVYPYAQLNSDDSA